MKRGSSPLINNSQLFLLFYKSKSINWMKREENKFICFLFLEWNWLGPRSLFSFLFFPFRLFRMGRMKKRKKRRRSLRPRTAPLNSSTLLSFQSIHFFKFVGRQQMKKWLMKEKKRRIVDEFIWRRKVDWVVLFLLWVMGGASRQCSAKGRGQQHQSTQSKENEAIPQFNLNELSFVEWMKRMKQKQWMNWIGIAEWFTYGCLCLWGRASFACSRLPFSFLLFNEEGGRSSKKSKLFFVGRAPQRRRRPAHNSILLLFFRGPTQKEKKDSLNLRELLNIKEELVNLRKFAETTDCVIDYGC